MKRISIAFSILICSIISNGQSLKLASDIWPPFTNIIEEDHYATDIVQEALTRVGRKSEINILDFDEVLAGIKRGEFDGSAALWISEDRLKTMIFSEPYLQNRLVLIGKKGSYVDYMLLSDIRGKKLAIVEAYDYGEELTSNKTINIIYGKSDQECLNMLFEGKVDYILIDNLLAQYLMEYQKNEVSKYLSIGKSVLLKKTLHLAIDKNFIGADKIIADFNLEIEKMLKDGTYNRLLNLSWILVDIDEDDQSEIIGNDSVGTKPPENVYSIILNTPVPQTNQGTQEYYIQGQPYTNWNSVPDQYKLQPTNNSNNVNILNFKLNKK